MTAAAKLRRQADRCADDAVRSASRIGKHLAALHDRATRAASSDEARIGSFCAGLAAGTLSRRSARSRRLGNGHVRADVLREALKDRPVQTVNVYESSSGDLKSLVARIAVPILLREAFSGSLFGDGAVPGDV